MEELGRVDVLVSNAAFQMTHQPLEEISDEERDHTLAVNLSAMFRLCKAAVPRRPGTDMHVHLPIRNMISYWRVKWCVE